MEATQTSINRQMDKEDVVFIYIGILLCHKNDEILPFATMWIDLKSIMLSEIRERQILYDITYMWNLKNTTTSEYGRKEADSQI